MKIAVLDMDNLKNPHWGGGQARTTQEVFSRLTEQHQITVFCSKYPGWKDYKKRGINYKHIGLGTQNALLNNIAYVLALAWLVPNLKVDLIVENFTAPFAVTLTPLLTELPVVAKTSFFNSQELAQKYHLPFHWITNLGIRAYSHIIAQTSQVSEKIKQLHPKAHTSVIPLGMDEEYLRLKTSEKAYILFLGRIDINQKGLDLLIQSWHEVAQKHSQIKLITYILPTKFFCK